MDVATRFPRLLVAGLCLGLLHVPSVAAGPDCEIVIGSCHRPPLSTAHGTGIMDRVTMESFRRIGRMACVVPLPCERSLLSADDGTTDGDILRVPAVIAGRYRNLITLPEPGYHFSFQGFATRPDLKIGGLKDLEPLRVGFVLGWKILEERVKAAEVVRVRGPEVLFPLLAAGKADLVIYERLTGLVGMREMGVPGRAVEPPLLVTPQHLVLNRRHAALVEPLAKALRAMKADGTYTAAFRAEGFEPPEAPP